MRSCWSSGGGGFRVIEGGTSEKLVVINSVKLAENCKPKPKRPDNVLRDIKGYLNSLSSDLRAVMSQHIRTSSYTDPTGPFFLGRGWLTAFPSS